MTQGEITTRMSRQEILGKIELAKQYCKEYKTVILYIFSARHTMVSFIENSSLDRKDISKLQIKDDYIYYKDYYNYEPFELHFKDDGTDHYSFSLDVIYKIEISKMNK